MRVLLDWDSYFMNIVYLVATRSKDLSTHHGAIIVGPDREIRSTGYNSFPRGINDNVLERQERPLKYFFFEHAERNSIYNSALCGISTKGCVMYTEGIPCADCARAVINAGIIEVVIDSEWEKLSPELWKEHAEITKQMFSEAGVKLRIFDGSKLDVDRWIRRQ